MFPIRLLLILGFFPLLLIFWLGWIIYWKLWGKKQVQQAKKEQEWKQKLLVVILEARHRKDTY